MAIGIPSGGLDARVVALPAARTPFSRDSAALPPRVRAEPSTEIEPDDANTGVGVARKRQTDSPRVARVERLEAGGAAGRGNPGIAAYLGVQQAIATEPHGGELVGIDFYV